MRRKFEPYPRPCPPLTPLLQRRTSMPHPVRVKRISRFGAACVRRNQAQHTSSASRPAGCAICSSRCALRLEPADWASLVSAPLTGARAPQDRARRVLFLRQRLAHGGASPDEDAHDDIFGFFVLLFAVERLFPVCRVVVLRLSV